MDVKLVRRDAAEVKESCRRRGVLADVVDQVLQLDGKWRQVRYCLDARRGEYGQLIKKASAERKAGNQEQFQEIVARAKNLQSTFPPLEAEEKEVFRKRDALLFSIGNLVHQSVVVSIKETDCVILGTFGTQNSFMTPIYHALLKEQGLHQIHDVCTQASYMTGPIFWLTNALAQYGLQFLLQNDFPVSSGPSFMNDWVSRRLLPPDQHSNTLYKISICEDADPKFLIPNTDCTLLPLVWERAYTNQQLPIKHACISTTFKSNNPDQLPQNDNLNQSCVIGQYLTCHPTQSFDIQEELLAVQKKFIESLGLPFRVICSVSGYTRHESARDFKIQAWCPGSEKYLDIAVSSNLTDYHARNNGMRLLATKTKTTEGATYVHTVSGVLCDIEVGVNAILENCYKNGKIRVPKVLVPFLNPFCTEQELFDFSDTTREPVLMAPEQKVELDRIWNKD